MTPTGTGIWSLELRFHDAGEAEDAAAELESLGYSALWVPDVGGDTFERLEGLLRATSTVTVATGILNLWMHPAAETSAWWAGLAAEDQQRLLLGIGVSHAAIVDPQPGIRWERPLATTATYLDALDAGGVPPEKRCLAALGPKMLALAGARSLGAHPYLVTPAHTATAREVLGDAGLFVEQGVVFETDPEVARGIARTGLDHYVIMPNYVNNWKRLGFTDEDVATRSDRLIDSLVAWGDVDAIAARVQEHRDAGADHVCVQVINEPGAPMNRRAWRELAPALT